VGLRAEARHLLRHPRAWPGGPLDPADAPGHPMDRRVTPPWRL